MCDNVKKTSPFFPDAKKYVHLGFPYPNSVVGSEEDKLEVFRETRSQIANWLSTQFNLGIILKQ